MAETQIRDRPDLLSVNRASKMLGLSRPAVGRRIKDGRLGAERIDNWFFVYRADVERLARERLNGSPARPAPTT
jgi:predicted transcriptional regulator